MRKDSRPQTSTLKVENGANTRSPTIHIIGVRPYVSSLTTLLSDGLPQSALQKKKKKNNDYKVGKEEKSPTHKPQTTVQTNRDSKTSSPYRLDMNLWMDMCLKEKDDNM